MVRSVTVNHILHYNGNKNVVRSIRHVSCFHLERYDKMIKIVYASYILTFPCKMKNERSDILKFSFHSSGIMLKSFHNFELRGGERLFPLFQFCVLEPELISSNSLFFTNLFCSSITVKAPSNSTNSNSTKQLY